MSPATAQIFQAEDLSAMLADLEAEEKLRNLKSLNLVQNLQEMGTIDLPLRKATQEDFLTPSAKELISFWDLTAEEFAPATLNKISSALKETPLMIAPDLEYNKQAALVKLLLNFPDLLATSVEDMKEPADTPPLVLRTTGGPFK